MPEPEFKNVILDMHFYQVFDGGMRSWSYDQHLQHACIHERDALKQQTLPTIVGEWSIAWKVESNYAATEPYPTPDQVDFIRRFFLAQAHSWEANSWGWCYWNFKALKAPMWDFLLAIK